MMKVMLVPLNPTLGDIDGNVAGTVVCMVVFEALHGRPRRRPPLQDIAP